MTETYGINLTPHFEKYQDQDQATADNMQAVWNFGNKLKSQGYKLSYMHGPVGLYEGQLLQIEELQKNFEEQFPNKDEYIFFLFQKTAHSLRFAKLLLADVIENRNQKKIKKPTKKKVVDNPKLSVDIPIEVG